ncbi:P-loop containing nucleoside triphosphate hydrolase protein [Pleomassaria siparia CBS 279.74]|uniref:P-loop containing nucleoside triphosphate hydrolase protein n=1 Tax=Pleomassaria siparia CBS 279.74 TaxID=1314801 RepID=A0A6G1K9G6_9PLEO|nr:P-loop containing nucleoside triphosphate hydrolase protein [Pleomassaria siparia CBS 279.74]
MFGSTSDRNVRHAAAGCSSSSRNFAVGNSTSSRTEPYTMSLETNIRRVLDLLVPKIEIRRQASSRPIILGITGLQGSGKSTWATEIVSLLINEHALNAITISLDDVYKTHDDLIAQRDKDPENKLYRTRGQPGTHDEELAGRFFAELRAYEGEGELKIPSFDKSQFNGEGNRAPESEWSIITTKPDVVIFEGWCVGFRPLPNSQVQAKHEDAQHQTHGTLADHQLPHLLQLNENLKRYCETFMGPQHFDFMIHIDTNDLQNVYHWRLQQEHALIAKKGSGMSDAAITAFVNGYMPGYELYLDGLRKGFFETMDGRQIRVLLDKGREVEKIEMM